MTRHKEGEHVKPETKRKRKSGESRWEQVQTAWWLTGRRRAHRAIAATVLTAAGGLYLAFLGMFVWLASQRTPGSSEQAGWAVAATLAAIPLGLGASRLVVWAVEEWRNWRDETRF